MATLTRRTTAILIPTLILASGPGAAADSPYDALVGQRVRLTIEKSRIDGTLLGVEDGHLLIRRPEMGSDSHKSVPSIAVRRIEVHAGRTSRLKRGLVTGAIVVGLAAGTFGLFAGGFSCFDNPNCDAVGNSLGGAALGAAAGALVGGGIGAGVGSLFERDVWKPTPTTGSSRTTGLSIAPTRGGARASFSVRF